MPDPAVTHGRRPLAVIGMAMAATLLVTGAASAATTPNIIRTAPVSRVPIVWDVATTNTRIAVVWTERDHASLGAGDPRVFVRTSADRGASWPTVMQIEDGEFSDEPAVAICAGRHLMIAYAVDLRNEITPKRWHIILYHLDLVTGHEWWQEMSTGADRAQYPDVACGADRVWVTWDDRLGSQRRILLRHARLGAPGALVFGTALDLGRSRPSGNATMSGPSVAAVTGAAYVTWGGRTSGGALARFQRFSVGPAPGHPVTAHPATTLRNLGDVPRHPIVAASGDRVTVVWPLTFASPNFRWGVRRSTDGGKTFSAQRVVKVPSPFYGDPAHVSMRGARVLVHVPVILGGLADTYRYLSSDGGATFARTALGNNRGFRVGGFISVGGKSRWIEVWDGHVASDRKLRFHRQS